jgi:hypothetical protein
MAKGVASVTDSKDSCGFGPTIKGRDKRQDMGAIRHRFGKKDEHSPRHTSQVVGRSN